MAPGGGVDFYLHPDPVVRLRRRERRKRRHRQKGTLFRNGGGGGYFIQQSITFTHECVHTK